jgi:ABC-type enterobactin transport system permease subunit
MSQARARISLGIILIAVVIAAAITTWAASPIAQSDSAGPTQAREVIYRPQHLLVY